MKRGILPGCAALVVAGAFWGGASPASAARVSALGADQQWFGTVSAETLRHPTDFVEPLDNVVTYDPATPDRFMVEGRRPLRLEGSCTYDLPLLRATCRSPAASFVWVVVQGSNLLPNRVELRGRVSYVGHGIAGDVVIARGASGFASLGSGPDRVDARGGGQMSIVCGEGSDVVLADPTDAVDPDCENVSIS